MTKIEAPCADCQMDTFALHEYYMVHHAVWRAAGMTRGRRRAFLCIGCLERRLGRELTAADFLPCRLNEANARGAGSERLAARLLSV